MNIGDEVGSNTSEIVSSEFIEGDFSGDSVNVATEAIPQPANCEAEAPSLRAIGGSNYEEGSSSDLTIKIEKEDEKDEVVGGVLWISCGIGDHQRKLHSKESYPDNFGSCIDSETSLNSTENPGRADETEKKPQNISESQPETNVSRIVDQTTVFVKLEDLPSDSQELDQAHSSRGHCQEERNASSEAQPEVNEDSNIVEHITVSVKLEDLTPSDSQKLDEAHSNSGQCRKESSDSQHFSKNCTNNGNCAKEFKCEFCSAAFARSYNYQQHLIKVHHERPIKCRLCLMTFGQKAALDTHLKTHESPFFKCILCPASFKDRSYLKAHAGAHIGAWVHKCRLCSAKFKTSPLLRSHMKVHSGENLFMCKLCSAGFSRGDALQYHLESIHTDPKQFRCPRCPAYFTLRSDKMAHLEIHHREKPFKCTYCRASYERLSDLKCHLKVHTKEYGSVFLASQDSCKAGVAATSESDVVEIIEIKEELPDIIETSHNFNTNKEEESEEPPMNFPAVYFKEESHADNIETHPDIGTSSIPTDNEESMDGSGDQLENRSGMQLKINTVEYINVSVKPEDLLPSDSQELGSTFSSSGQCEGEFSHSDSKRQYIQDILGPFQCEKCPVICEDLHTFGIHLNMHSGGTAFFCPLCPKKCCGKASLQKHLEVHTDGKMFKCELCSAKFNFLREFEAHSKKHSEERRLRCEHCSKEFFRKPSLIFHLKAEHKDVRRFACKRCPARLKSKGGLRFHLRRNCRGRPYKCRQCPLTFLQNCRLQKHVEELHIKGAFECALCLASFEEELALNNHMKTHESPFFKCMRCSASFKEQSSLEVHKKVHTDAMPFECKLCPLKFTSNLALECHLKVHRGEYPCKCKLCPLGFPFMNTLRRHIKSVHIDVRKFKCRWCPAYFKRSQALTYHTKVHTGERPFKCSYCPAGFTMLSGLIQHLKMHRREERLSINCASQDLPRMELASSSSPRDSVETLEIKVELPDVPEVLQNFDVDDGEECQDSRMTFEATASVPLEISSSSCRCEVSQPSTSTSEPLKCNLCIKQEVEQQ